MAWIDCVLAELKMRFLRFMTFTLLQPKKKKYLSGKTFSETHIYLGVNWLKRIYSQDKWTKINWKWTYFKYVLEPQFDCLVSWIAWVQILVTVLVLTHFLAAEHRRFLLPLLLLHRRKKCRTPELSQDLHRLSLKQIAQRSLSWGEIVGSVTPPHVGFNTDRLRFSSTQTPMQWQLVLH